MALQKQLKPIHLWAISVGMVISGQYFGWNYGFEQGGIIGLAIATLIVTVFYTTFMFSYAELSTSIPQAGGPSAYARRALGPFGDISQELPACLNLFLLPLLLQCQQEHTYTSLFQPLTLYTQR